MGRWWPFGQSRQQAPSQSDDAKVAEALQALLDATTAEDIRRELTTRRDVLLSDAALDMLREQAAHARSEGNAQEADGFEVYFHLLERARAVGVDTASDELAQVLTEDAEDEPGGGSAGDAQPGDGEGPDRDLVELRRQAHASNDPSAWNELANKLIETGHSDEAIPILERLTKEQPEEGMYRVSLATAFTQTGEAELAKYHLRYLIEHDPDEQMRALARQQLEGYERFRQEREGDVLVRQRQLASLREVVRSGRAREEDYEQLGRMLLAANAQSITTENPLDEAIAVLEAGLRAYPHSGTLLDMAGLCYLRAGLDDRLEATVETLKQVAPDSALLKTLAGLEGPQGDAAEKEFRDRMRQRCLDLVAKAQSDDSQMQQAAVAELHRIVTTYPTNPDYRNLYAFALLATGQAQQALAQAEIMERSAGTSHSTHFNVGQIFWLSGDPNRGKQHLELALKYAKTEQDRRDARDMLAQLEGHEL